MAYTFIRLSGRESRAYYIHLEFLSTQAKIMPGLSGWDLG